MRRVTGFTLIELLIVVAIIAILAAIAVPNFLEAQVRSKVSRVYSEMRSLIVGMESYRVDNNKYPPDYGYDEMSSWKLLTTPIAYLTSVPLDVFPNLKLTANRTGHQPYTYYDYPEQGSQSAYAAGYLIFSVGPNRRDDFEDFPNYSIDLVGQGPQAIANMVYDPTNGTVSYGEIIATRKGFYNRI